MQLPLPFLFHRLIMSSEKRQKKNADKYTILFMRHLIISYV
jgi:hypothetical protein